MSKQKDGADQIAASTFEGIGRENMVGAKRRLAERIRGYAQGQSAKARVDVGLEYTSKIIQLAKLSAKTPQFFNPLEAMAAEKLRDEVLAQIIPGPML